ncbi:MAG: hypothetical protein PHR66_12315, partial [Desulfuromonadaceae bacterium]|nr:hypothetical protein [Desulfuromonadaceae bacterium]
SPLDSDESKEELTNANGLKTDYDVSGVSTQPKDYELLFSELPESAKSKLSAFKRREDNMNDIESIIFHHAISILRFRFIHLFS